MVRVVGLVRLDLIIGVWFWMRDVVMSLIFIKLSGTCTYLVIYLYECSMCRYVRLNALNLLHIYGPCFNTPVILTALNCQRC